jgi:hypothetical protein
VATLNLAFEDYSGLDWRSYDLRVFAASLSSLPVALQQASLPLVKKSAQSVLEMAKVQSFVASKVICCFSCQNYLY